MFTDKINNIIIWGHKLHTHTHSYIHYGFHKAFTHLGYKCFWIDETDDIEEISFENSLIITEGQTDNNIPICKNAYYVLHNCDGTKYKDIPKKNKINLQVYTKDCTEKYNAKPLPNEHGFYLEDCIIIYWGTDLLPYEINTNILRFTKVEVEKEINFVGMPTAPWDIVKRYCIDNNIKYNNYGGFNKDTNVSCRDNMKLIQKSIIAPSFQEEWQVENHYVPCRIFKNISYGKMGITNNPYVNKIFDEKLIYGNNIDILIDEGIKFNNKEKIIELMKEVRDKHTYLNRINAIFWLLNRINNT